MTFRAYLGMGLAALPAAALSAPPPEPKPSFTARQIIERQLAAKPARPADMSGAEATRIRELYLGRMGQKLEPQRGVSGGRTGS